MSIPQNGRVVIIDDKLEEEALPLIEALSKRGIPYRFFTGRGHALPKDPIGGVRIIFLDMVLEGMDFAGDTDQIVQSLVAVIGRIIGVENGPYVILGWTKTPQHLDALVKALPFKPVLSLDMEKNDCFSDRSKILEKIEQKLALRFTELGSLSLFLTWEDLVHNAAYDTVNQFHSLCKDEPNPSEALTSVLYRLAKADLGKQISNKDPKEVIASALQCLNGPFLDTLESYLDPGRFAKIWSALPKLPVTKNEVEINSRINSRIHVAECADTKPAPGNIYEPWDNLGDRTLPAIIQDSFDPTETRKIFFDELSRSGATFDDEKPLDDVQQKEFFRRQGERIDEIKKASKCYLVEVSPFCDHAQMKWKRNRLIPAVLWPFSLRDHLKRNADFLLLTPSLFKTACSKVPFHLVFDFRHFFSCDFDAVKSKKPVCRLRKDLVFEIQNRLARHINRGGLLEL